MEARKGYPISFVFHCTEGVGACGGSGRSSASHAGLVVPASFHVSGSLPRLRRRVGCLRFLGVGGSEGRTVSQVRNQAHTHTHIHIHTHAREVTGQWNRLHCSMRLCAKNTHSLSFRTNMKR